MDAPCQSTNAASRTRKASAGAGRAGGRTPHPTAATTTAAAPIQNNRDWLEPSPRKRAAKTRAAAVAGSSAPRTAGRRIAAKLTQGACLQTVYKRHMRATLPSGTVGKILS